MLVFTVFSLLSVSHFVYAEYFQPHMVEHDHSFSVKMRGADITTSIDVVLGNSRLDDKAHQIRVHLYDFSKKKRSYTFSKEVTLKVTDLMWVLFSLFFVLCALYEEKASVIFSLPSKQD